MLPRFFNQSGIDLVNLGDTRVFMLMNDNLYTHHVDNSYKNYTLANHYDLMPQKSLVDQDIVQNSNNPKYLMFILLWNLIHSFKSIVIHDVGCFVGEFGLQIANFARTHSLPVNVQFYDPTISGQLVPYNIILNNLNSFCTYNPVAVSNYEGLALFSEMASSSDSSKAIFNGGSFANSIVPVILLDKLIDLSEDLFFLKLDTENQEFNLIESIKSKIKIKPNVIVFEYHVVDDNLTRLIYELSETHYIIDIGYLPKPFISRIMGPTVQDLLDMRNEVAARPYRYTDILAISRNIPNIDHILARLNTLTVAPSKYELVLHTD